MEKVLVTGAAGFIGSHVAQELCIRGFHVTALDDLSNGFMVNVPADAHFVHGSVIDSQLINELFERERFDYVYHFAAHAAESLSHFVKRFSYMNNVIGSVNLINASINSGTKCFVFASSIAVYGNPPDLPTTEDSPLRPEDPYGIAKLAVEHELRVSKQMFDLDYIVFRPHNVYGENQNIGDPYRNVIGIFMNQILGGKPMTIFGDGMQTRAFSYIGDVAPIMAEAISVAGARNQVFDIGADQPTAIVALAETTARAMGVEPMLEFLPARKEVRHAYSSHEKLRRVFGRRHPVSLESGLGRMTEWVKRNGVPAGKVFTEIEVMKNFPDCWRIPDSAKED